MPGPSIVFSFLVATLLGSTFHLIVGGDARRLALFLLTSWVGFALGQIIGDVLMIDVYNIGAVHMFSTMSGAMSSLLVMWILTRQMQPDDEE